jgi:hypothetical protein
MHQEIESILGNFTWMLAIKFPLSSTPIKTKSIFRAKTKVNGEIEKLKAKIVTKGY